MDISVKESLVKVTIEEAEKAIHESNSPFGAVLADFDGGVIHVAHNTVKTDNDPTAHAEINLIRKASKENKNLSDYYLVSNAQSCPMCFSAAVRAGISNFLYGYAENETLVPNIDVFEMSKYCESKINIETGILNEECKKQLERARAMKKS